MNLFDDMRVVWRLTATAVHVPDFLDAATQLGLMTLCNEWGNSPGGWHSPKVRGGEMSVDMVCLGWHWYPYGYSRITHGNGDHPVQPMPELLRQLGRRAIRTAIGKQAADAYEPDVAIVNRYGPTAKMGMHQDRDEHCNAPVVSLSLGASAMFRFGNSAARTKPYTDVELLAGDAFVFWGDDRFAYHGITKIVPTGTETQRINITIRQSGLSVVRP